MTSVKVPGVSLVTMTVGNVFGLILGFRSVI